MKITLENNRKNAFHLNVPTKTGVKRVTIPAAMHNRETNKTINGRAEVDGDLVAQARKNSEIVRSYFSNGWLREIGAPVEEDKKAA